MADAELRLNRTRVEAREIDGELVIYDLTERSYLAANRTAAVLWPLLDAGTDLASLTETLASTYAIDAERARADAEAFVDSLRSRGLLSDAAE